MSNDTLIISFPLHYEYFIKPARTLHEFAIPAHWRSANDNNQKQNETSLIFDNLNNLRLTVNKLNELNSKFNIITILNEFRIAESKLTVSIIGNHNLQKEMNDSRLKIFQNYSSIEQSAITINLINDKFCFEYNQLSNSFIDFIQNVSRFNQCSIFVTSDDNMNFNLIVIGFQDNVSVTINKLRLFIDDCNPQLFSDFLELDSISLLPLISGIKSSVLNKISKQTNCQIYTPNVLPNLFFNNSLQNEVGKPKIYFTGLRSMVLLAKNMVQDVISKISVNPFIKQLNVMPIKREVLTIQELVSSNTNSFSNMMMNSGCYLSIPPLGSNESNNSGDIINFQGNSIEDVEILIDDFMEKISSLYCAKVEFQSLNKEENDHVVVDINKLLNFSDTLCFNSNSFISLSRSDNQYIFQILGNSSNTKLAINYLTQFSSYIQTSFVNQTTQYQIELPNKEKDFIAGKKNGKIIKIINLSNSAIKLLPLTDNNFIVELKCNDLMDSVLALGLFEDELPTSLTFNVPESFHRQIIGVGGQTIQAIMRRFNVFVKFSNSFELTDKCLDQSHLLQSTNFQQSFIRKNNVVIKCPAKNKSQIYLAKNELEKLVEKVTKNNYSCCKIQMNNQQWKLMTSMSFNTLYNINRKKSTNFITELEKKTNTFIKYPDLDSILNSQDSIQVNIFGIDNNSKICCSEFEKILPYCYEFKVNKSINFNELIEANKFNIENFKDGKELTPIQLSYLNNLLVPLKLLYNSEIECVDNSYESIMKIFYYPNSYGYPLVVTNANSENVSTPIERISQDEELKVVQSDSFKQVITGVNKFLRDWNFDIISSNIGKSEVMIDEIVNNREDNNMKPFSNGIIGNTNKNINNNTNNNNNNTNNNKQSRTSKYRNGNSNKNYSCNNNKNVGSSNHSSQESLAQIHSTSSNGSKINGDSGILNFNNISKPEPVITPFFNNSLLPTSLTSAMELNNHDFNYNIGNNSNNNNNNNNFSYSNYNSSNNGKIWG